MFSRALWARQIAPLRRQAIAPFAARRSVTTDAASAHAEDIPQVRFAFPKFESSIEMGSH
jgi:pyruvate dehydrogenase E1 component subunit alpha